MEGDNQNGRMRVGSVDPREDEGGLVNLPLPNLRSMIGKKYRYKIDNNNEVTLKITGVTADRKLITDDPAHTNLAYEEAKFILILGGGRRRAVSRKRKMRRRSRSVSKKNSRTRK
jgi:hypothetical protein